MHKDIKKIRLLYAKSLTSFTQSIQRGFDELSIQSVNDVGFADRQFVQIHGAPHSKQDDFEILSSYEHACFSYALVHRPDELLLDLELSKLFFKQKFDEIILLGDYIPAEFKKLRPRIIPHPYTDLSMPSEKSITVGTFTSFGEMRKLNHCLLLMDMLTENLPANVQFMLGGLHNGKKLTKDDINRDYIVLNDQPFIPHFNLQLYHLNEWKRYAESSGSLHRGISIPVIFEANGIERIEKIKVIKIQASDDLKIIGFEKAQRQIVDLIRNNQVLNILNHNYSCAKKNQPIDFCKQLL